MIEVPDHSTIPEHESRTLRRLSIEPGRSRWPEDGLRLVCRYLDLEPSLVLIFAAGIYF